MNKPPRRHRMLKVALTALTALGWGHAAPADFAGEWTNVNSSARGITRVVVTPADDGTLSVRAFGKCSPTDCDWGEVAALTYGANVQDADFRTASAVFEKDFATTLLVLNIEGRLLSVQSLTEFTDDSGRQNYAALDVFRR